MTGKAIRVQILTLTFLVVACASARADDAARAKAQSLVNAAIQLTDSNQAVKMLWQATDIDPTDDQAYIYLGLYYDSREDFDHVVQVYQKLIKYHPNQISAYLNIGEAYMSFQPPRYSDALPYYQKAYKLDPHSGFAALRLGELLAHSGDRDQAIQYLKQAADAGATNPSVATEATKELREMAGRD
jgi:tetratricopeptide (TPR) repeat protein